MKSPTTQSVTGGAAVRVQRLVRRLVSRLLLGALWRMAYAEEWRLFEESRRAFDAGDIEASALLRGQQMGLAHIRTLEKQWHSPNDQAQAQPPRS